ncbi:MAG TPA: hypothetical protein VKW76_08665 [Candidatus Binatia bacterium]|nr:hypothetical protein [Candidatus Binatia bacterium]
MVGRRHTIYLVPGFFGFANLGELRYFGHVHPALVRACRAHGIAADVRVVRTHPTASLRLRAVRVVEAMAAGAGPMHLVGHSTGGLDARLVTSPGVSLPTGHDVEALARRVRTVITVAAPHYGTPLASPLTGLVGRRLLQVLSLSTIYVLRFGRLPLSAVLALGAAFARLDRHLGVNSALLDQLFGELLDDFSPGRRRAIGALFAAVARDQALLLQVTAEGMDVFNATTRDRPGVRYGAVVTRARRPGLGSTLAAGLDPSAQATHALYQALYRLAARTPPGRVPPLARGQASALRRAYGRVPGAEENDGVVPTRSQVWGDVIHAARADHHDVLGHFDDPQHVPPHFDWLATGTGFDRTAFEALWEDVARWIAGV